MNSISTSTPGKIFVFFDIFSPKENRVLTVHGHHSLVVAQAPEKGGEGMKG
jgi:hypothetical protein